MTLHVTRSGQNVTVHSSFGIGEVYHKYEITENALHLRHFWSQLGRELDEAERELKAAQEADE